jgi:GDP-4-dehydro-6-deoxy-D-mannose reductase
MRALVTGGAGFAGSHLTDLLLSLGWEVTVLAAEQEGLENLQVDRVEVVRGDLRDAPRLESLVRSSTPDRVYHLAALPSPSDSISNPRETYEVNFLGTLNLLLGCRELGDSSRFLFVSSSEVYGSVGGDEVPLREESPMRPANPYAGSKAAAELLAYQFFQCYGMQVVRVRPFNHTGPRQSSNYVCSDFARQIAEIEVGLRPPRMAVGNLKVRRDFSDVRDIVRGYYLLLENGVAGEVYQLGSGRAVEIGEILDILLMDAEKGIEVVVDPARVRASESAAVWGEISKAERAFGWARKYTLDRTLRDLKNYWRDQLSFARPTSPGGKRQP